MTFLSVVSILNNWQGGTIHQAVEVVRRVGRRGTGAYKLGVSGAWYDLQDKKLGPYCVPVPVNSFEDPATQTYDYLLGLLDFEKLGREEIIESLRSSCCLV